MSDKERKKEEQASTKEWKTGLFKEKKKKNNSHTHVEQMYANQFYDCFSFLVNKDNCVNIIIKTKTKPIYRFIMDNDIS